MWETATRRLPLTFIAGHGPAAHAISRQISGRRNCLFLLLFICMAFLPANAALKPETRAAYEKEIAAIEARLDLEDHRQSGFLWIDSDPSRLQMVKGGGIATAQVKSLQLPGEAMIQHWIGGEFLPQATLAEVERIDQNYAAYGQIYGPDLSRPKVLANNGNHFIVSYRITEKRILTAVMDTIQAIDYEPLGPGRLAIRSRSESVRQVENPGTPSERVLPEGEGDGLLWAMNSYWRMEQRDGGVYVECEAVTLSRNVPFGLGPLVNPILRSFAEDSLKKTLAAKRKAVESRK